MSIHAGIDPGLDGGIVAINGHGLQLSRTPVINAKKGRVYDTASMLAILRDLKKRGAFVTIEQAHAFPKIGAGTNFAVGHGYGQWLGMLAALEIPHMTVSANAWTKKLCAGVNAKDTKARALIVARRLWPHETFVPEGCRKPHDGLVDAALLAEYGRRERA